MYNPKLAACLAKLDRFKKETGATSASSWEAARYERIKKLKSMGHMVKVQSDTILVAVADKTSLFWKKDGPWANTPPQRGDASLDWKTNPYPAAPAESATLKDWGDW